MIGRLRLLFCLLVVTLCAKTTATPIDDLETMLRDNPQVQEKIYVHTDNSA